MPSLFGALLLALSGCGPSQPTGNPPAATTNTAAAREPTNQALTPPAASQDSQIAANGPINSQPGIGAPPQPNSPSTQRPNNPSYADAVKEVEATIKRQPEVFSLRMQAAEFYMRAEDHNAAIPHLQVAARLSPKSAVAWIALGDAATIAHKPDLAGAAYAKATAIEPSNPFLIRGKSQLLMTQKKFKEARDLLESALKSQQDNADLRSTLGSIYLILNRPRRAQDVLLPAVKSSPDRADLHFQLGEAYERDLHLVTAIEQMREAARCDPNYAEAWGRIGLYLVNLTHYAEAREPLQKAISINPREPHYYWALGDSYLLDSPNSGSFDKAAEFYKKALSLDPNDANTLYSYAMGLTRRGRKQDLQEAIPLFDRLLKVNPNDLNSEYKLYEIYRDLGRPTEAAVHEARFHTLFGKGAKQTRFLYKNASFKDSAEAHMKKARVAMKSGQYELASTEFQLALERNRTLDEARKGIMEAQRRIGHQPNLSTDSHK